MIVTRLGPRAATNARMRVERFSITRHSIASTSGRPFFQ